LYQREPERIDGHDGPSLSSTTMMLVPGRAKTPVKTVAQHHQTVVGFLLGFFFILVLFFMNMHGHVFH
jgi:hypothetical protein